ncbi:MAG: acetate/propionate family kinase [Candidatus Latescibacteria bacterium]|nr:acetate/propionate family kinase [Candidatus Latescibacterota bacterium]
MKLLIANVGSTSFKFQLFESEGLPVLARGRMERIGSPAAPVQYQATGKAAVAREVDLPDYAAAIHSAITLLTSPGIGAVTALSDIAAIGFKPVHGLAITGCRVFTDDVLAAMEEATPLAPAHNPPYVATIRLFRQLLPDMPLLGLFEPTFHQSIPEHVSVYGVPYEWMERYGIRRYGFHGASHQSIAERTPVLIGQDVRTLKLVSCHLGGSSSVCAIYGGQSVDTSMGLSPQSGLMQSTRCGDLDPFGVLYLMDREQLTTNDVRRVLCKESGLRGLSGVSGDMRDILEAARHGNRRAELAVNAFTYEVKKSLGAYAAAMGGLDAVVFTGGMGERSAEIRSRVCAGLEFLGLRLDTARNAHVTSEAIISTDDARVVVAVIPTDEERIIARAVAEAMNDFGFPLSRE